MQILQKRVDKSNLTRVSFTIKLAYIASAKIFTDNTISSFTLNLPAQLILDGQWEMAILEISYSSIHCTKKVTEEEIKFFDTKIFSNSSKFFRLEPGVYH